jgi:hypothetical protein
MRIRGKQSYCRPHKRYVGISGGVGRFRKQNKRRGCLERIWRGHAVAFAIFD